MLVLLAGSATFSGAEAALFTLARLPAGKRPLLARRLLGEAGGVLTVILLANNVVNIAYFAVAAGLASTLGGGRAALASAGAVLGIILFGEILPKILAHRFPAAFGALLLPPVALLHALLGPFANWLGRKLTPPRKQPQPPAPSEVDRLLEREGRGLLEEEERGLVRHVLELGTLRAGAVRRPLSATLVLSEETPLEEAREALLERDEAWGAVADRTGEVRGILDLTRWPSGATAGQAMTAVPVLPEVAPVSSGLELLRETGAPFILLVDEYGDSAGIIERGRWAETLLDKIPEQPAGRLPAIVPLGHGRFQVDASLPLHVFRERFVDPGEVDVRIDTLGGLVQERLARIPKAGDKLRLGGFYGGVDVRVVRCHGSHVTELEVCEAPQNDGTPYTHPRAGSE